MQQFPDTVYRLAFVNHDLHGVVNHPEQGEKLTLVAADVADLLLRDFRGKA